MINDTKARAVARDRDNGPLSPSRAFVMTGTIRDVEELVADLEGGVAAKYRRDPDLVALIEYVRGTGPRGAVTGWSETAPAPSSGRLEQVVIPHDRIDGITFEDLGPA